MGLVHLPPELIDHISSYLDWNPIQSLCPSRLDLLNTSLTCRRLRRILEPAVFRHVTLRLCWAQGQLLEPRWYCLRRERPELSKHVRTVYINTGSESEQCLHCSKKTNKVLAVPEGIEDWLKLWGGTENMTDVTPDLRARVNEYARRSYQASKAISLEGDMLEQAEDLVRRGKLQTCSNAELDALSIFMLCIPASTTSIVFKASIEGLHYIDKNRFSHRILSVALELLHDRVLDLTIISNQAGRQRRFHPRTVATGSDVMNNNWILDNVISKQCAKRLTIAMSDEDRFGQSQRLFVKEDWNGWHQLSHTLREIDIRYTMGEASDLLHFIEAFPYLAIIRIRDCVISFPRPAAHAQSRLHEAHIWLSFALQVRKAVPNATIEFENLWLPDKKEVLPNSAVRWIVSEAVAKNIVLDVEREDRLVEDFVSFLPMWEAEDGVRGSQAMSEWTTQRGHLSALAMSRRWR